MYLIIITSLISTLGYLLTPDSTPNANEQFLEFSLQYPGFKAKVLNVRKNEAHDKKNIFRKMLFGEVNPYTSVPYDSYYFEKDDILLKTFFSEDTTEFLTRKINIADVIFPLSVSQTDINFDGKNICFTTYDGVEHKEEVSKLYKLIQKEHLKEKIFFLGTDRLGRDILSQLIIGSRVSLSVGFISVFISLLIGITLGAIGGYFRGWIDDIIVWFINVIWSIPTLLLVIAITFALGKGFWQIFIAVGLTMWVEVARVVRGQVLSIREKEFIEAARALGYNNIRIIFKHIIPNVISPVIVISAANFASAILIEAGLSFLGIGVQPPMPSWGTMIKEHYNFIILDKAFLALLPGAAIMIMVMAFMIVGNGLRDALDVKVVNK
ncbi:MAG: ABC transporter permease [Bacteroidales bacterium]|nr:ABC transporter permease [Bacteroidales bacterium]